MQERIVETPYIPQIPTREEVEKALERYYEVSFIVKDGAIEAKSKIGIFSSLDYTGKDSLNMMPIFSGRPECSSCFFIQFEDGLFYQTVEYIKIFNNDMSLKKLYLIKDKVK